MSASKLALLGSKHIPWVMDILRLRAYKKATLLHLEESSRTRTTKELDDIRGQELRCSDTVAAVKSMVHCDVSVSKNDGRIRLATQNQSVDFSSGDKYSEPFSAACNFSS